MSILLVDTGIEWIGEIPSHWEVRKLNSVAKRITDYVASGSSASLNKNVKYLDKPDYAMLVRTVDLSKKTNKEPIYINKHAYDFLSNSNLFGGELILSNIGSVGNVYYFEPQYERNSLAPNAILVDMEGVNKYFYYMFISPLVNNALKHMGNDAVQSKFNKTQLRQLKVISPPIEEQQKIADFLDDKIAEIDSIIANTKQSIEELKKYKISLITETVTKGLNPNVELEDSQNKTIPSYPEHWKYIRIKYLLGERKEKSKNGHEEALSMSQKMGLIPSSELDIPNPPSSGVGSKIVFEGDLVFNKLKAHLGVFSVSKYNGSVSPDYAVYFKNNSEVNTKYLEYLFKTPNYINEFKRFSKGIATGLTRLYTSDLFNIKCTLPPINEQENIVNYIENKTLHINSLISNKERLIEEILEYKKSLIYEYVTGKKEVM